MKILFNTYPMAFHTPGGGEIQLINYKDQLTSNGVEVGLFNQWDPNFNSYELVHFFSVIAGSTHFCNFVKGLNLPLVVSSSLWITEETKELYPIGEIKHQMLLADKVIANSNIECEQLSKVFDLPLDKFITIYNGIDDVFFEKIQAELFINKYNIKEKFILNVGNIEPRKNQLKLVEAMKLFPEYKLVLIGHKRDAKYSEQVLDLGGDQVLYIDPLDHKDRMLRSAYAACDVFCLPSTLETPGLAALEAAASGCNIAITEVGATKEYFGESVEYLNPNDVDSISLAIKKSISNDAIDNVIATDMKLYTWSEVSKNLLNSYSKLIKEYYGG